MFAADDHHPRDPQLAKTQRLGHERVSGPKWNILMLPPKAQEWLWKRG